MHHDDGHHYYGRVFPRHPLLLGVISLTVVMTGLLKPSRVRFSVDTVQEKDLLAAEMRHAQLQHNFSNITTTTFIENLQEQIQAQQQDKFAKITDKMIVANRTNATSSPSPTNDLQKSFEDFKSSVCLTEACIQKIAHGIARAFPDRTNKDQWCISASAPATPESTSNDVLNTKHRKQKGLILVKVPKSASSTMAGVVLRLGHKYKCDLKYIHRQHVVASKYYGQRHPQKSILLLSVRDPAQQLVSNLFWSYITLRDKANETISDEYILRFSRDFKSTQGTYTNGQGGHALAYASLTKIPLYAAWSKETHDIVKAEATIARVKAILEGYDFVAVVERMEESLVALSLLLGVPVGDVLVTSSKVSGGGKNSTTTTAPYVYSQKRQRCLPMVPSVVPPVVQRYFESDLFQSQVYGDSILHAAASRSLDLTIERLGRERFQEALKEYRYWKDKEREECASRVEFPCSSSGQVQLETAEENCYENDFGCGYQCIDEMLARGRVPGD